MNKCKNKKRNLEKPKTSYVYKLKDFTAHKVFNGLNYECLLTNQLIGHMAEIETELCHIDDYKLEIYKPDRFNILKNNQPIPKTETTENK